MIVVVEYLLGEEWWLWRSPFETKAEIGEWWNDLVSVPENPALLNLFEGTAEMGPPIVLSALCDDPRNPVIYLNGDTDSVLRLGGDTPDTVSWVFHRGNPRKDFSSHVNTMPSATDLVFMQRESREELGRHIKRFLLSSTMES